MPIKTFEKLPDEKKKLILSTGIKEFAHKSYNDVSTDALTKACGISKGILFHYFGSKKQFYLYCLEKSMKRLTEKTEEVDSDNFYDIIFSTMNRKMALCLKHRNEMLMVNMATRDADVETAQEKAEILGKYMLAIKAESAAIMRKAVSALNFKNHAETEKVAEGLHLYINAVINKYLLLYQNTPENFFENSEDIKTEMKSYLDFMRYGICG